MTISVIFILLVVVGWGLYRRHLHLWYGIAAMILGIVLAGTTLGHAIGSGVTAVTHAASTASDAVSR